MLKTVSISKLFSRKFAIFEVSMLRVIVREWAYTYNFLYRCVNLSWFKLHKQLPCHV